MTSEELEALEKLEKAATPGPWHEYSCHDSVYGTQIGMIDDSDSPRDIFQLADTGFDKETSNANAGLMAVLRNAAPALIAAARENARLRAVVEAANQRATEAERRLALAVAEVRAWRACKGFTNERVFWAAAWSWEDGNCVMSTRSSTDSDPELAKMIGAGGVG